MASRSLQKPDSYYVEFSKWYQIVENGEPLNKWIRLFEWTDRKDLINFKKVSRKNQQVFVDKWPY